MTSTTTDPTRTSDSYLSFGIVSLAHSRRWRKRTTHTSHLSARNAGGILKRADRNERIDAACSRPRRYLFWLSSRRERRPRGSLVVGGTVQGNCQGNLVI